MAATFIPQWTTSDRLRKAREAACLEQGELAERIGIARQTVNNYERGRTTHYRRIVLRAWADATGVPVEWLVGTTDQQGVERMDRYVPTRSGRRARSSRGSTGPASRAA